MPDPLKWAGFSTWNEQVCAAREDAWDMDGCVERITVGQEILEVCAKTGAEAIWSPTVYGSQAAWADAHLEAHARKAREIDQRAYAQIARTARSTPAFWGPGG